MKHNIEILLEKFWEGDTSVEEEQELKNYFQGQDIAEDHQVYLEYFAWTKECSQTRSGQDYDIDNLLERYWSGEAELKEEEILKAYFKSGQIAEEHEPFTELFKFFKDQSEIEYLPSKVETSPKYSQVKSLQIRKILYSVAAVSVLVFGAIFVFKNIQSETQPNQYSNVKEIEDPEEAMRVTKEALALVSKEFRKSQETVTKNMGTIEKVSIFK
jgi:hypothetical protein